MEKFDTLNYVLGKYIAYAFHEPKKYPKKPLLVKQERINESSVMTDEEMERVMRMNVIKMGGVIK